MKEEKDKKDRLTVDAPPSQVGNIIVSVIMAIIGLVFIWMYDGHEVQKAVLFIGGLAFIIPGAALLMSLLVHRKDAGRGTVMAFLTGICGLAALALGIVILVIPDTFHPLLVYLFGALLIVSAVWQFDIMLRKNRGVLYPGFLVVAPVLVVALGVVLITVNFFHTETNEKWMLLASGIGFTLYGLIGLLISYYALRAHHIARKEAVAKAAAEAAKPSAEATADTAKKAGVASPLEAAKVTSDAPASASADSSNAED